MSLLGDNIKRLTEDRGWTLKELSRQSGVEYSTLHNLVVTKSQTSLRSDRLQQVADALGVSAGDLLIERAPVIIIPENTLRTVGRPERELAQIQNIWYDLPPDDQEMLVRMAKALKVKADASQEPNKNEPSRDQPRTQPT